ncbi:MAG: epoxyqueuosine reductase [Thermoleophilia bacterium]
MTFIQTWLNDPEHNNLGNGFSGRAWEGALVGFSNGADPAWNTLKQHVAPHHWTPIEAFVLTMAGISVADGANKAGTDSGTAASISSSANVASVDGRDLTVISWALCQSEAVRATNRAESLHPSEAWTRACLFGQENNVKLHRALLAALNDAGYAAIAPSLLPEWQQRPSPDYGPAPTWSERHVAYASGLGTFGLSGGLITARGKAHRLGSVIVRAHIPATPHAYDGPFDYCLFLSRGLCGRCATRCPVGSINTSGRDKDACARHLGTTNREYVESHFGLVGSACGLCQTGVPCEAGIPTQKS